ncbi:MAG: ABC-type transport auxiliary lipoprotein family protein [Alphaproteobacteria bacterium]
MAIKPDNGIGRRTALLGLGAMGLVGCESVIPGSGPSPRLYRLTPKSTFPDNMPSVDWQLLVETPYASASLNTVRIGLMPKATQFDYYALANWTDRAPLMVQGLIVESFENSGRIVAVGREAVSLKPDFILKIDMREFQAEAFTGSALHEPRVGLSVKLVGMPERLIVASTTIERRGGAGPEELSQIIQAWDEALGSVLKELVNWTLEAGQAAWAARQRPQIQRGFGQDLRRR